MEIQKICALEQTNTNSIYFVQEGLFYRCYERSAQRFTTYIKGYKTVKRFYKNVGDWVVYIGFPASSFDIQLRKIPGNRPVVRSGKLIEIQGLPDASDFETWKQTMCAEEQEKHHSTPKTNDVLARLKTFPVMERTPLETQAFVVSLQKELNETDD